jgi:hypothetical protein
LALKAKKATSRLTLSDSFSSARSFDPRVAPRFAPPRLVTASQLRTTKHAVVSLGKDFHFRARTHAGRTKKNPAEAGLLHQISASKISVCDTYFTSSSLI